MVINGYDVLPLLKKTGKEIGEDRIPLFAAQMAYNFFFSLFPLLIFVAAFVALVADRQTVMGWVASMSAALPPAVAELLRGTLEKVIFVKGAPGLLSFGLLTAAWSGSAVFGSFMEGLNSAFDVEETRSFWKTQGLRLGALLVSGVLLTVATVILLNGEGVVDWLGDHLHIGAVTRMLWTIIQIPLAIGALVGVLWAQYVMLPNRPGPSRTVALLGAVLATVLWTAATLLFRLYVQKAHALNPAYGAIGGIMILLTWMYYSSFVLLAVGELIAEIDCGTARVGAGATAGREHASAPVRRPVPATSGGDARVERGAMQRVLGGLAGTPLGAPVRLVAQLREWVEGTVAHVREDLHVLRQEIGGVVRGVGTGVAALAAGGVLALLGTLSLLTGLVLLVGDQWLPRDLYWLAALLVAVIAGGGVAWAVRRGLGILRGGSLAPEQAIAEARATRAELADAVHRGRAGTPV